MKVLADLPWRAKVVVVVGLVVAVAALGKLSFGPLVRARVAAAAERRGVQIEVHEVRLGLGAVWLKGLDVRVPSMPGVTAQIEAVRVGMGWHFNVSALAVHGVRLLLKGEFAELRQQFETFRGTRGQLARAGTALRALADGIDIVWLARPGEVAQQIWGLSYQRDGERERVALDLVRLRGSGLEVELRRPRAALRQLDTSSQVATEAQHQIESLQADGLDVGIALSSQPTPTHLARAAQADHFQPDLARGPRLRALLAEFSRLAARSLPDGADLNLEGVSLHLRQASESLNFGPSSLRMIRRGAEIELSVVPKTESSGAPLEFRVSVPLTAGEVHAQLRGGPVSLRSLGVREGDFGLSGVQTATLQASGDVRLASDGSSLAFSGNGLLDRISLRRPELSPSLLSGIQLAFRARGTSSLDGSQLTLEDSEVSLGEVRMQGRGRFVRGERTLETHWSGGVPLASCQAFLDATPRGLAPLIASLRMAGTFAVQAQLDFDSEHPNETRVRLEVANDCRIAQVPPELSPRRFESYWRREVRGADRGPMEIESGPGSPDWVPYDAISPFMETAVLVCEDGHFPFHHGFDFEAMQNSIRDNLIQGRFARGASTVSMQLAKNLYLGKEKTLGRKLQEAVLTQLLEQELSKRELMELYLNVIEYAPGIYGIGPAARYYFAKRPSDLSLAQALYIATILPNPERQHFQLDGKLSATWTKYLQQLMHIAKKIGRIGDEQLAAGLAEQVAFHVADAGGGPPAQNPFPEEGSDTPNELSP
jgi:Transglycosylase